jgi:hypothetical protein
MTMPPGAYSSSGSYSNAPAQTREQDPEGYSSYKLNNYTDQQMQLHGQQFGQVAPNSYLSRLAAGDPNEFAAMEKPALQQFNALQGNIASRFSGMGMGARNSSGFQNSMNSAAQDFAGQLQSNRAKMRQQAIMDLMGLSNQILGQKPYEKGLVQEPHEEQGKALGGWGSVIGGVGGGIAGMYMGNPMLGASLGSTALSGL